MLRRAAVLAGALALVVTIVPLVGRDDSRAKERVMAGRVHRTFHPREGKLFVLVIGNDAREGNPDAARADAIHIVGINTRTMHGGILNFPRDSWVTIPGHGSGRINEALYRGGPRLLAQTLESITGIRLDYWVMTGFEGFRGIIRRLHGIRYTIHRNIFDPTGSGARLRAGKQHLNAGESLAYVRTRHSFPRGDIDRTTNQARFLLALLRRLRDDVHRDPGALFRWVAAARQHTRFDMTPEEVFRLAVLATQVKAPNVGNVTVPVTVGSVGAASVVFISPGATSIYRRFRTTGRL
jgi:LCP family protein required for cell wall assembly